MSTSETIANPPVAQLADRQAHVKATVLLAEDDAAVRRYLEVILRRAGYAVVSATNGLEALRLALTSTVDAVVTDALMPHLSGHELCRHLRARPELARVPIIILSGLDQTNAAPRADEHADARLTKPVRPEEFTDCIARLLATRDGV